MNIHATLLFVSEHFGIQLHILFSAIIRRMNDFSIWNPVGILISWPNSRMYQIGFFFYVILLRTYDIQCAFYKPDQVQGQFMA